MTRKKTTLYVDDGLWQLAKAQAAIQNQTLGEYLNGLIEEETKELALASSRSKTRSKKRKIKKGKET